MYSNTSKRRGGWGKVHHTYASEHPPKREQVLLPKLSQKKYKKVERQKERPRNQKQINNELREPMSDTCLKHAKRREGKRGGQKG